MITNSKKLVLEKSYNAIAFEGEEFLQHGAFERVKTHVDDILSSRRFDTTFDRERGHYSILVNGQRGSGKTTFALSVLKRLEKDGRDGQGKIVISLGVLDPTLIESKEHVLLAVINKIKEEVEERTRGITKPRSSNQSIFDRISTPLDGWYESLKGLADGLKELDGVGKDNFKSNIWEDSFTIMEEGLTSIGAGLALSQRLHSFINYSLSLLGADGFVLALDDIDTFFEKGWPVMESLRKYLTSPGLITLVCGDLELYEAQVKKNQWQQLGQLVTDYERGDAVYDKHVRMVQTLTEQYLQKVLPTARRIELEKLSVFESMRISRSGNSEQLLNELLSEVILHNFGAFKNSAEHRLLEGFLLNSPLRMMIQLLSRLETVEENSSSRYALPLSVLGDLYTGWVYQYGLGHMAEDLEGDSMAVQHLLGMMHRSSILQEDLELLPKYINAEQNTAAFVISRVLFACLNKKSQALDYMIRGGLLRQALYFESHNRAELEKSAGNKKAFEQKLMRYLGATTSEDALTVARLWSAVVVHGVNNAKSNPIALGTIQILSEGAFNRSRPKARKNLYRTDDKRLVAAYAQAEADIALVSTHSTSPFLGPGLRFMHAHYIHNHTKDAQRHYILSPKGLQQLCKEYGNPVIGDLAGLPFTVVSEGENNNIRASSFPIIGLLAGLIGQAKQNFEAEELPTVLQREVERAGQIRTYSVPVEFSEKEGFDTKRDNDIENDEEYDEDGEDNLEEKIVPSDSEVHNYKSFYQKLSTKLKAMTLLPSYPPFVWSRIWQRFYYTVNQQDKGYKLSQRYLGEILHRQIIAFLNAVLVEELRYKRDSDESLINCKVSLNNPVFSDDIFIENLARINEIENKLVLFGAMCNLPILMSFFSSGFIRTISNSQLMSGLKKSIVKIYNEAVENEILSDYFIILRSSFDEKNERVLVNLYDLLNLVSPARSNEANTPTLWEKNKLDNQVLESETVKEAISEMLKTHKLIGFSSTHLTRNKNAEVEAKLRELQS